MLLCQMQQVYQTRASCLWLIVYFANCSQCQNGEFRYSVFICLLYRILTAACLGNIEICRDSGLGFLGTIVYLP